MENKTKPDKPSQAEHLRKSAEERLREIKTKHVEGEVYGDAQKLIHELQVHQIELEMQNEELKKARLALEESRDRYIDLYDFAPVGYITFTGDGLIAEINLTCATLLGVVRQKLINNSFRRFVAPEYRDLWDRHFLSVLEHDEKQSCDLLLLRDDGPFFYVRLDSIRVDLTDQQEDIPGKTSVVRTAMTDITDLKHAEESIRQAEVKYRSIFENAVEGIFQTLPEGQFLSANPAMARMLGYDSPEELISSVTNIGEQIYMHPEDRSAIVNTLKEKGVVEGIELQHRRKDGSLFWALANVRTVKDKAENILRFEGTYEDITERKQADAELKESKALFEAVVENIPLMIFLKESTDLRFVIFNRAGEELLGYDRSDLMGKNNLDLFPPEQAAHFMAKDREVLDGEADMLDIPEEPILTARKGQRLFHTRKVCIRGSDGTTKYLLGISEDITEHKQAEGELKQQADAMEASADGIAILNEDQNYVYVNEAHAKIYGYDSSEELIGKSWHVLYDEDELQRFDNDIMPKFIRKRQWRGEATGKKKDGSAFSQEVSLTGLDNGGLICVVRDITERKRAEESLKLSEQKYRNIFENVIEGIFQTTPEGHFFTVNPVLAHIFGYNSAEEMIGAITNIGRQLYANPDDRNEFLRILQERGTVTGFEVHLKRKDGNTFWASINARAVKDETGDTPYSVEGTIEDITSRKLAEEELKQTLEKLRKSLIGTIQALSLTVETRDPYTAGHQKSVSNLARAIAQEMGLPKDTIDNIRMAGAIHDIGKISVPAEILSKPGKLSDIEFSLIKVHSQSGYDILKDVGLPYPVAEIVLQHHERLDGSGYPQGLNDDQILPEAKIVAVADVVEAMSSHRPYRPAKGIDAALEEIKKNKGTLYDTQVVEACLRLFRENGFSFE